MPKNDDPKFIRLPDDWQPGPGLLAWVREQRPDMTAQQVADETENFKEHWYNTPGQKGKKRDWNRAWQTWMRRANPRKTWGRQQTPSPLGGVQL